MKDIGELTGAPREQEILSMPDVRVIGKAYTCTFASDQAGTSPHDDYWNAFFALAPLTDRLPRIVLNAIVCWTGDSPMGSDHYTYMPGILCPAGTPVPDGLDHRDLPASLVAVGVYGDEVDDVIGKFVPLGYATCYTDLGWNAKLFLTDDEIRRHENAPCRWLVPCVKAT
ncbi:MAG: GyrI-like domain-containing protein [Anaerolineae bacterium]